MSSRACSALRVSSSVLCFVIMSVAAHAQFRASLRRNHHRFPRRRQSGATVTLINTATNEKMVSTSDASGIYQFNALRPAPYRNHRGTRRVQEKATRPRSDNSRAIEFARSSVGARRSPGDGHSVWNDTDARHGDRHGQRDHQYEPNPAHAILNRDVFQLAQLAPGVFGDASQQAGGGSFTTPGNQGPGGTPSGSGGIFATENGPQIQSAGGQYETNSIAIDGISTVSAVWGGTSIITPSEDSVEDMKVVSNSYDAENGRFSGAQIQVTTKSGTNQFHGSAFFKASRPGLNAYQRWNGVGSNNPGTPSQRGLNRDESRFNQYGGSLGGPIWKNKIFAFFNWETSPLTSVTTAQGWYETSQFDAAAATPGSIAAQYLYLSWKCGFDQRNHPAYMRFDRFDRRSFLQHHDRRSGHRLAAHNGNRHAGPDIRR